MNLDLKKFKKIDSNEKHTVLKHENGHEIRVAHKGLSDQHRKELESIPVHMAKGGHAKFAQKYDPNIQKKLYTKPPGKGVGPEAAGLSAPSESSDAFTEPGDIGTQQSVTGRFGLPKLESRPKSKGEAQAEMSAHIAGKRVYPPCINPSCKSFGDSHPNCRCYGGNEYAYERFADGGEVKKEYYCDNDRPHFKGCEYFAEGSKDGAISEEGNKLRDAEQEFSQEPEIQTQENQANSSPAPSPLPPPQEQNASTQGNLSPNPEMQGNPEAVANEPERSPAQEQGMPKENYEAPNRDPFQDYQQNITNNLMTQANTYQQELDNQVITPKHYFHLFSNGDGVLGKIGSVFGLMLSGIGSGLTGQPNAALTIMNNEINRDMEAQEKNVGNKQNFLRINQEGLMNQSRMASMNTQTAMQAKALAISNQRRSALHYLVSKTQNMPQVTPQQVQQKQKAMQTLALMSQQIQAEDNDTFTKVGAASAMADMISGGQGGGQPNTTIMKSGMLGPQMAEVGGDIEQKTIDNVPSVAGQKASRPVPQDKRDQVQNMNVLDNKAKELIDFSKAHEGSWNPQTRAKAQQMANEMVGFYSSSLGTSMTEGNRTWLDEQIAKKNPTSAISQELYGSNAKLQEIERSNNMRRDQLLKTLGFNPKQEKDKKQDSGPQSKSGRPMIQKNGKWYYK